MKSDYSEKEFEMIKILSPRWAEIIERGDDTSSYPPCILRILAQECFIENKIGPAVDSLRRCLKALMSADIYRRTPEYDDLIVL